MEPDRIIIEGKNAVLEALRSGREVDYVIVSEKNSDRVTEDIIREVGLRPDTLLKYALPGELKKISPRGRSQGILACVRGYGSVGPQDIIDAALNKGEDPFIIIIDGIEDPHNLGAIIRTADICGAHGVIFREKRSCGITPAAISASAGAVNYVPAARVTNIARTIDFLKSKGIWIVVADMDGEPMYELDLGGPVGLVIGSEGRGVSELLRKKADFTASVPMYGNVNSLNASVAAGVLAYEIVRQRHFKKRD